MFLNEQQWRGHAQAHAARAEALTRDHVRRRAHQQKHPIEDFLFTYYSIKPAQLRRWHPGAHTVLENGAKERANWKYYTSYKTLHARVDLAQYLEHRGSTLEYIHTLLKNTLAAPARFSCFALHEWVMVYKLQPEEIRHTQLPLRLGHAGTDEVVRSHEITCGHFDAYRFFAPEAVTLNRLRPTRETQPCMEQAGCLHANMDLYKWAGKLGPIIPGELLLDCFELAKEIRIVDMQASPYNLESLGYEAIAVETASGKAEFVARQREFATRANILRKRLIAVIEGVREAGTGGTGGEVERAVAEREGVQHG